MQHSFTNIWTHSLLFFHWILYFYSLPVVSSQPWPSSLWKKKHLIYQKKLGIQRCIIREVAAFKNLIACLDRRVNNTVKVPLGEVCTCIWIEEAQDLRETPPLGKGLRKLQGKDSAWAQALLSIHWNLSFKISSKTWVSLFLSCDHLKTINSHWLKLPSSYSVGFFKILITHVE